MTSDPRLHQRRSVRLRRYDCSQPGAYFVTVVTRGRARLFGDVVAGQIQLNDWGAVVREEWFRSGQLRPYLRLDGDEFVVMPNHVHGIIWITEDAVNVVEAVGARRRRAPTTERFGAPVLGSVPTIVRAFKSATTRRINAERGTLGTDIWQRNYYEHVIRGDEQLARLRGYIVDNRYNGSWTARTLMRYDWPGLPLSMSPGGSK